MFDSSLMAFECKSSGSCLHNDCDRVRSDAPLSEAESMHISSFISTFWSMSLLFSTWAESISGLICFCWDEFLFLSKRPASGSDSEPSSFSLSPESLPSFKNLLLMCFFGFEELSLSTWSLTSSLSSFFISNEILLGIVLISFLLDTFDYVDASQGNLEVC